MKKAISGSLILCSILIALSQPAPRASAHVTTDTGNAYALGVSMGFVSFQTTVHTSDGRFLVREALLEARNFANLLKGSVFNLDAAVLQTLIEEWHADLKALADSKVTSSDLNAKQNYYYSRILPIRNQYRATLQQVSKQMGNAYDLGVAISVSEAQATVGEAARAIVRSGLVNAQGVAANLGLPGTELGDIIAQIDQGVALTSIYGQVSNLRGKYQSFASALKPATIGPKIGPSTSAPANPDTVLLKLDCTRTAVGEYKCPTQRGYETCQAYEQRGLVKACSTKVNPLVQSSVDKMLFSVGCTRFLGRADEFICKTQKGLDLCETYRKNGTTKKCLMAKQ